MKDVLLGPFFISLRDLGIIFLRAGPNGASLAYSPFPLPARSVRAILPRQSGQQFLRAGDDIILALRVRE